MVYNIYTAVILCALTKQKVSYATSGRFTDMIPLESIDAVTSPLCAYPRHCTVPFPYIRNTPCTVLALASPNISTLCRSPFPSVFESNLPLNFNVSVEVTVIPKIYPLLLLFSSLGVTAWIRRCKYNKIKDTL